MLFCFEVGLAEGVFIDFYSKSSCDTTSVTNIKLRFLLTRLLMFEQNSNEFVILCEPYIEFVSFVVLMGINILNYPDLGFAIFFREDFNWCNPLKLILIAHLWS